MKKRAKIITTVASLCLAVALMAFGVYAATQVTLTVSSNVSFEVTDIFVTVSGNAKLGAAAGSGTTVGTDYSYVSYETVAGQKVAKTSNDVAAETWTVNEIEYTSANNVVTYTLIIANDSAQDAVDVTLALSMPNVAGTFRSAKGYQWDSSENDYADGAVLSSNADEEHYSSLASAWSLEDEFTIEAGESLKIVLVRTLEDTATTLSTTSGLSGTVTMEKHVASAQSGD